MFSLQDKVAVVTGGASGIGLAMAGGGCSATLATFGGRSQQLSRGRVLLLPKTASLPTWLAAGTAQPGREGRFLLAGGAQQEPVFAFRLLAVIDGLLLQDAKRCGAAQLCGRARGRGTLLN